MRRNPCFARFQSGYLFPEIARRREQFLSAHPEAKLISLGIGDTTEPLAPAIVEALEAESKALGTIEGYRGYGPFQGDPQLQREIARTLYSGVVEADEVFVSDGAKCDIGRLQVLFGSEATIAVQDPTYPVYVDTSIAVGQKGGIVYMACRPENGFFPDLEALPRTDVLYFCSPNNPTGAVATREQLQRLVDCARANCSLIVFDSAYAAYIQGDLPRSIYEVEGAQEVAIEVGSFSKLAGFTGVRLGWTVVPKALKFDDGTSVWKDWCRMASTFFNGPSVIAERGGLAALRHLDQLEKTIGYYRENAALLREGFQRAGYQVHGGEHAPYLWIECLGKSSWEAFHELLEGKHLLTIPGSGFGPAGEGFFRVSALGRRADVLEALRRLDVDNPLNGGGV